uniref:Uncharacterized protein n=1 Tax=Rhizophora mucronata TaxID=61149 RepID=A0A2P2P7F8_RHIMU
MISLNRNSTFIQNSHKSSFRLQ